MSGVEGAGQGNKFLFLFALANAGGVVAYVPLLTLLLPAKVEALSAGTAVEWLGAATLVGAVAASLSNILFGWASDSVGTRRAWATAGLFLTIGSYALLHLAATPSGTVAAVAIYQIALNMMLAPLTAWAAEMVPDERKGVLGGTLGAGLLVGALAGVVVTAPLFDEMWLRMAAVCLMVLLLTLPLLFAGPFDAPEASNGSVARSEKAVARRDFALLWIARLFVQVTGSVLFAFLLYYFERLQEPATEAGVARLSALSLLLAFPIALTFGRRSDRIGRRKPFLIVAAIAAAVGVGIMALATGFAASAAGYALFGCGSAVFLSLHASYAMQLLPSPAHRGRDLGVLNLTNTLPAIIAPTLAIALVPGRGFATLLAFLSALMLLAAFCVGLVKQEQEAA